MTHFDKEINHRFSFTATTLTKLYDCKIAKKEQVRIFY
jgi:hypothetical protein